MRALTLLLLLVVFPSCSAPPSGLPPNETADAYHAALLDADADRALALLEELADTGNLLALSELAHARRNGYLEVPYADSGRGAGRLTLWPNPVAAALASRRFERALRDSVQLGSEAALFLLAERQMEPGSEGDPSGTPEARQDSLGALYRHLVAAEADPFRLAFIAQYLGDEAAFERLIRAADAAGDPHACVAAYNFLNGPPGHGAEAVARIIDHYRECRERAPEQGRGRVLHDYPQRTVGALARNARDGNAHARVVLDSLHTLGVFDRHPELAATANDA